jgi:hypothetical protein
VPPRRGLRGDHILDAQLARFLQHYRPLLPEWFLEAAHAALGVSPFE